MKTLEQMDRMTHSDLAAYTQQLQAELDLLRELRADVDRYRENGGDVRDLCYIIDTMDKLDEQFPVACDGACDPLDES